jgi:DNA-directed RNA polymerase specialized sigma24 family protein
VAVIEQSIEPRDAVSALIEQHAEPVFQLALQITGVAEQAAHVTERVLAEAAERLDRSGDAAPSRRSLEQAAARAAYAARRADAATVGEIALADVLPAIEPDGHHFDEMVDWSPRVADPRDGAAVGRATAEALDALPADYRTALVLRDMYGHPDADIGATLGITPAAARTRVHHARLFVRQRLSARLGAGG